MEEHVVGSFEQFHTVTSAKAKYGMLYRGQ
jgi:hypothetical protein